MTITPKILGYALELVDKEYAFAAFSRVGFADEREFGMLLHVHFQRLSFFRQQERYRAKAKLLVEGFSHSISNRAKNFLPGEVFYHWIPILIKLTLSHFLEVFVIHSQSKPIQITSHCCLLESVFIDYMLQ